MVYGLPNFNQTWQWIIPLRMVDFPASQAVLIAHRTQQRSLRDHESHVVPPEEVAEVHQHLEHQICTTWETG